MIAILVVAKMNKDGKVDPACKSIQKVEWKTSKNGSVLEYFYEIAII